jgi:hypothetical protein
MLHLMRTIDRATGYVFLPKRDATAAPPTTSTGATAARSSAPNSYQLFSSAAGPLKGPRSDVRDVQERWVDAREEWDQWEEGEWRREGEAVKAKSTQKKEMK